MRKERLFIPSNFYFLNEENVYVPRFKMKQQDLVPGMPTNKEVSYQLKHIKLAIEYGMILKIKYKGAKHKGAPKYRYIYPVVVGTNKSAKPLLRAWHLKGFSVSKGGEAEKMWRMFRTDRIITVKFEGAFYQMMPDKYNPNDKHIVNRYAVADMDKILKNQDRLKKSNQIEDVRDVNVTMGDKVEDLRIQKTNTKLSLTSPLTNQYIYQNRAQIETIKVLFLKGKRTNFHYAVFGVVGEKGKEVNLLNSSGMKIENAVVVGSVSGDEIKKVKKVDNLNKYELYLAVLD